MLKMISSPNEAIANIFKFEAEVERSVDLQARLAYARSWYAVKFEDGKWRFGPSKFVGYQDMDAETYLEAAENNESDGRRTEAQLQAYFMDWGRSDELNAALVSFLAKFGKKPSTKARIFILRDRRLLTKQPTIDDDVVTAMAVIARAKLSREQISALVEQLEDHLA
ncbi:hypothetical protein XI09_17220 [Bradyrhizobium sp. CCBAU 11386]|uniref:hypothetical protein n=1 Tax=Bradyrhizobium sp. CCBAU 11386 TaxID=1630837 RepID=UPI0023040D56|nr:hypothetical protein [Bradyrhizobium sp. CCBAU 11386]MDA9506340.1 hypothetical protein [Bradyrhizobium sp. CCBAU 11386]